MHLRILSAEDVRKALPMATAIEAMKQAFGQYSAGRAIVPLRVRLEGASENSAALFMPAVLRDTGEMAVKVVTVYPTNLALGLPTIHALVLALDAQSGRPLALLEGASLTAIRTGAASGAATDLLARNDARTLAIFGSGAQARTQLEAVCTVRSIERAWIFSLDLPGANAMVEQMAGRGPVPDSLVIADTAGQAVAEADVICTATTSSTPGFDGADLRPGTHINAIGAFTPTMQEVDSTSVRRAVVFVDSREAAWAEAGDLIIPMQRGEISADKVKGELGEIVNKTILGRESPAQITLFESVGLAVQDAVAAGRAITEAQAQGIGRMIEL